MAKKHDLVYLELTVVLDDPTKKAVAVVNGTTEGGRLKWFWLPRSLVEIDEAPDGGDAFVTMPEWLAVEKELV